MKDNYAETVLMESVIKSASESAAVGETPVSNGGDADTRELLLLDNVPSMTPMNLLKSQLESGYMLMKGNKVLKHLLDSELEEFTETFRRKNLPKPIDRPVVDTNNDSILTENETITVTYQGVTMSGAIVAAPENTSPHRVADHAKWELQRVISGHTGWVRTIDVDVTNDWFVTGSTDRLIKVWDLASGELKVSLTGHVSTVRDVKVSDRNPYLFSCGEDNMVKCWDLEMNRVIRHFHGHLNGVYTLALHPTLDILCSAGRDAVVRTWDIRTRGQIHVLEGHGNTVEKVICQNYEPQVISAGHDKTIRCWDLAAGKTRNVLTHHKKAVRGLASHPSQYKFMSASGDAAKQWKGEDSTFERNFERVHDILHCCAIKDDSESALAVGGGDTGLLYFWDYNSGKLVQTIETQPQPGSLTVENAIFDLRFDRSETRLMTAECDKTIKIYQQAINIDDE